MNYFSGNLLHGQHGVGLFTVFLVKYMNSRLHLPQTLIILVQTVAASVIHVFCVISEYGRNMNTQEYEYTRNTICLIFFHCQLN